MNTSQRLVTMANQIARNFSRRPAAEAAAETATHIKQFWEKRMISQILDHLDQGGTGLDETAKAALQSLRLTKASQNQ
jgi:formate dehydrogenase subunit delta